MINIEETNKYKIGVSTNPRRRLRDISSYIPFNLKLLAINKVDNPYFFESEILKKYNSKLIKNEWFELGIEDVKWIMITLHNKQVIDERP